MKLSSNENPLGASPKALAAYRNCEDLHRYPDSAHADLRAAIGAAHGLNPERIVCGAGSDELLHLLAQAYAGVNDEVVYSQHGFLIYPISTQIAGAVPVTAPETELTASVDGLLAAITPRTKIVFLANPNNPTGTYLSASEVARLHAGLPAHVLLVLDGAYAEYVDAPDYTDGRELVDAHPNVVMLRTFSKIYGLPALRIGWVYAPEAIVDVLQRIRGPFNVCSPALAAGIAAMGDEAHVQASIAHNRIWRGWLAEQLQALGLHVVPSQGNFLLVRFDNNSKHTAQAANQALVAANIIVRDVSNYGLPDCLRITIGTEAETRAVAETLAQFLRS